MQLKDSEKVGHGTRGKQISETPRNQEKNRAMGNPAGSRGTEVHSKFKTTSNQK